MKQEYGKIKAELVKMVYRSMYRSNYSSRGEGLGDVTNSTSNTNKRALAIAVSDKHTDMAMGAFCVVSLNAPISNQDSNLNKRALELAHELPLTKP
ncbi:hypothetical protein [Ectothiorhodospira variabilis]|uniref:hypothetical protein n=1 Tax=Ectothiorhodospira variabilis TaxID=505694 RepID=UPI001EFB002F|nr:hypothetical protein [Ectothiorhodospira variabilis]MCG5498410.1 hypothetical protein [Ectothiorhodospira variabilis]